MRRQKENEFAKLQDRIERLYRGWEQKPTNFLSTPLNNARLDAFTTYEELVPAFEQQLARHDGDIDALLTEIKKHGLRR
jgi:predicted aminopeptidase